jgi:hypothetical protein
MLSVSLFHVGIRVLSVSRGCYFDVRRLSLMSTSSLSDESRAIRMSAGVSKRVDDIEMSAVRRLK